ncbi:3-deoxy-D-manno-octulosonic acid transferase [Roseibium sediminis]|uniref:3-deoxy-D-manno-octulosonic acid transferase n=1 Tax=Roseibium sediminis TaxID=1775174 RepID=UPI00123D792F|nr:3-deoxy-D-manno-octulosonic acid transferase [Roseibium sediminis]
MAENRPLPVTLYVAAARAAEPLYRMLHKRRVHKGKDDPERGAERFGVAGRPRPGGQLVWLHAASVGETNSILPLVRSLSDQGTTVLLTTVTRTSAEIAEKQLPESAIHQYAPFDSPRFISAFLDHWQPTLALFVESEIWPATLSALRDRGCPVLLVNGRMSARSHKGWSRAARSARDIFGTFDLAFAQSEQDGKRLAELGCTRVECPGNLKFDSQVPDPGTADLATLRAAIGERIVWLAALTHPGEDEAALAAHKQVLNHHPDALLLLVPRHPDRRAEIRDLANREGFSLHARSEGAMPHPDCQVYLGDTLGEMGLFYSLANVAFLGGSVTDRGGHNPLEAIQFETALVTGPHVANARNVYRDMWSAKAARRIEEAGELGREIIFLLENTAERTAQISRAKTIIENGRGALGRVMAHIETYLKSAGDKA